MIYKPDKYGNDLSILGFGCMRLPSDFSKSEALILDAFKRGVNYFDTAYIYPGNEELLGQIVAKNGLRDKINIATKLPLIMTKSASDFDKFFNTSLKRLKTDRIDYYLMHMITTPEQWKTLCGWGIEKWIDEKKAAGQIKQLGFSFHGKREDFVGVVDARDWDFCMIQYNYLDINNQAGRTGLKHAASKGIPVFIMEPLLGGRLANPKNMPADVAGIFKNAPKLSPAARGLRWVWNHGEVTLLLSGMNSQQQLDENIATAEAMVPPGALGAAELGIIDSAFAAFNAANKIPCTGCGYCVPCPFGVSIPGCFASYNTSYNLGRIAALKRYVFETAALTSKKGLAGTCKNCGKCEEHCPQGIPIREALKTVRKRLEPFWFKAGIAAARTFTMMKAKR
jgi:predicted aldo/keto reductase-like oxidoreductase